MNPFQPPTETRWMLVDDNREILAMLSAMLKNLTAAAVECFDTPQAALTAFQAAPGGYELVITDFEMPGMDGVELCRQLRAISPAQKVFLATGSGFFTAAGARHAGFAALLNKPFPSSVLKSALAETFAGDPVPA
jgi:two-component system cell cycle sensor histidine kinase/response regulator CckA